MNLLENLEQWKRRTQHLAREGARDLCSVWVNKFGQLTKFLTREPGSRGWAVNPKLKMAFDVQFKAGLRPQIVYCFEVAVLRLEDPANFIGAVAGGESVAIATEESRLWHECNPTPPDPSTHKSEWLNWYYVDGPQGQQWNDAVVLTLSAVNDELRPLGLRAEAQV